MMKPGQAALERCEVIELQKKRLFAGNFISDLICIMTILFSFVMLWNTVTYHKWVVGVRVPVADRILAVITCLAFFNLLFFLYCFLVGKGLHERKWSGWVLLGLIVAAQVMILAILRPVPFWDELSTSEAAYQMFTEVNPAMPSQNGYFTYYGNNYPFVITEFLFCRLLSFLGVKSIPDFWPWMIGLNILLLDMGILIYSHLLDVLHSRKASYALLFISLFNPYTYLCAAFVYTTTWSIFFTAVNLYLLLKLYQALKARKKSVIPIAVLLGAVMAYGASIRVVSLIPVIAAAICMFIRVLLGMEEGFLKPFVKGTVVAAAAMLLVTVGSNKVVDHYVPAEMQELNFPAAHWIMMSFNEKYNGGYSIGDEQMTAASEPAKKSSESIKILEERIKELAVTGKFIPFLDRKLRKTWTECWTSLYYVIDNSQNYGIAYSFLAGEDSLLFRSYYQMSLAVVYLAALIMSILRARSGQRDMLFLLLTLSFLGATLFHLIWEANGFYSISFLYLVYMICAMLMAERSRDIIATGREKQTLQTKVDRKASKTNRWKTSKAFLVVTLVVLAVSVIKPLTYHGDKAYHSGWSVNSTMRRPDLEYEISSLGKSGQDLKQGFEVPGGFRINTIELLVETTGKGKPGYLFTLCREDGEEVYSQVLDSSSYFGSRNIGAAYRRITLPEDVGEGRYFFKIRLNGIYNPLTPGYEEFLSFRCRSCLGTNYNPYGELLVNGAEPNEGRSNLVFNAYYKETPKLK